MMLDKNALFLKCRSLSLGKILIFGKGDRKHDRFF